MTCGATFVYEEADDGVEMSTNNRGVLGVRGDIRLGARALDGNSGTLAFAFSPNYGDVVFDSADSTLTNTASNSLRLFNIITHELGHSMGLDHVCPINRTKLMEPSLTTVFRGVKFDEFQSLQRLYGDTWERGESDRENDSVETASDLVLEVSELLSVPRLSLDDNVDHDFFRFEANQYERLSVRVIPGEGSYLEGGDTNLGCSPGVLFNSGAVQDLVIRLLAPDGTTELLMVDESGLGGEEEIELFTLPESGDFLLEIDGDTSNAAQLYELEVQLDEAIDAPRLALGTETVVAESGSVKNARLDPNETIRLSWEVLNEGNLPTGELEVSVTGGESVTIFETAGTTVIGAGETGTVEVVFGAVGLCGDVVELGLSLESEGEILFTDSLNYELGSSITVIPIDEDFDTAAALPAGWSSEIEDDGELWGVATSRFDSAPRSAFSSGVDDVSSASLLAPAFVVSQSGGTLSFSHAYRIERGFDGGVLEARRNGGEWFDLITDSEVVVTGGYNRTIRTNFESPIAGRGAWSGDSITFVPVTVDIPDSWAGDEVQVRWLLAHDNSTSDDGWWVDNVQVEMLAEDCEEHRPALSLELVDGFLVEAVPEQTVTLQLSSELPLVQTVPIELELGGTAEQADFVGTTDLVYPVGVNEFSFTLTAFPDELAEGDEILELTVPDDAEAFTAGDPPSVQVTVLESETLASWSARFFDEVDLAEDDDGDGWSNLAEYLLGSDPTDEDSRAFLSLQETDAGWLIPLGELPERSDATLGVEAGDDLEVWAPVEISLIPEGVLVEVGEVRRFYRLTFHQSE